LDRDVLVLEAFRLVFGLHEKLLQTLGEIDLARLGAGAGDARTARQFAFQVADQTRRIDVHARQEARNEPFGLLEERQEQVLAVDLLMPEAERLRLRALQGLLRFLSQSVDIHKKKSPR